MTSTRRKWRRYKRLHEQGRDLASQREDLIAAGADPADLPIPLTPVAPAPRTRHLPHDDDPAAMHAVHLRQLVAAAVIVAVACLAAFAGCVAAAGAMLAVNDRLTWHTWVPIITGLVWVAGMIISAAVAGRLYRHAREARA